MNTIDIDVAEIEARIRDVARINKELAQAVETNQQQVRELTIERDTHSRELQTSQQEIIEVRQERDTHHDDLQTSQQEVADAAVLWQTSEDENARYREEVAGVARLWQASQDENARLREESRKKTYEIERLNGMVLDQTSLKARKDINATRAEVARERQKMNARGRGVVSK